MTRIVALACVFACSTIVTAQPADSTRFDPVGHYEVYTGTGERADLSAIVSAMADVDVVFLGEQHNDPTGHALELMLLEAAQGEYGSHRQVVVAMEMFERDVQPVLDEYLAGYIREQDLLKASRPWSNYETRYRPLIEYAKENGLKVVATNAPSRYVSLARRRGLAALDSLMNSWFFLPHGPPVEGFSDMIGPPSHLIASPSAAYEAKFRAEMADTDGHGSMAGETFVEDMLVAQNLRDATMAFWIARNLAGVPPPLLLHVNGSFHSARRLGIPERLLGYSPGVRILVVTMIPADDINGAPAPSNDDFIILTDKGVIERD